MKFLCVLMILFMTSAAGAETVYLTDGTKVEGKLSKAGDGWTVTQSDGKRVYVSADQVSLIVMSRPASSSSGAAEGLASLRRVAEHLSDVGDVIGRYQKFIDRTTDAAVLEEANQDLAVWQDRSDKGLVKLGDQWITPEEVGRRRDLAQSEALAAKDLIPAYRYEEADKLLRQALADDPQSATALYLDGVMLYKQEQVDSAKKAFTAVNDIAPNHAPTLNNLAVISWRQKSFVVAMNFYDMAMMAAPMRKTILDNVAEALNAVPDANKHAPVVQQAVRLFAEQDAALQKIAAEHGLYRWGSNWVDAKTLADLKAQEAKIKLKLDDLARQYDDLQTQIGQIDGQIDQNTRAMNQMQANSIVMTQGATIQMPLPGVYYTMQSDNQKLGNEKKGLQKQQGDLKDQAAEARQEIPTPRFTGVQALIGVEGVPVRDLGGGAPTTGPAGAFPEDTTVPSSGGT